VWTRPTGFTSTVTSLTGIAEGLEVRFHYDAPVERIDVAAGRAVGVTLENGEQLKADVVIANTDTGARLRPLRRADPQAQQDLLSGIRPAGGRQKVSGAGFVRFLPRQRRSGGRQRPADEL